jgi:hypothetical protein
LNNKQLNINLNCLIKVKLTDYGKDIFYHQYDELNKKCGRTIIEPRFPDVDSEGYSQFQLWDFMHVYGKHMMLGTSNVIHPLSIYIDDENLKEFIE